jgi:hypothetical protein
MPLSLSDDEYAAVMQAAGPIHPSQRDIFLQTLAKELERYPVVGPRVVFRCASEIQLCHRGSAPNLGRAAPVC